MTSIKNIVLSVAVCLCLPGIASAFEVVEVEQSTPFEISNLQNISDSKWLVGELNNFPHTFEFVLVKPTTLRVQVMTLLLSPVQQYPSLIVVKEMSRGVSEVMRKTASTETWATTTDSLSNITFLESSFFSETLDEGVYRLEVSNPNNIGNYVLKIGLEAESIGYWQGVKNILTLRRSLGYNTIGIITNKYIYIPLFVMFSVVFFGWYWRSRKQKLTTT